MQPKREVRFSSDRTSIYDAPVGALELIPKNSDIFAKWNVPKENLLTSISSQRLKELAAWEFEDLNFEFRPPKPGLIDKTAASISSLIRTEVNRSETPNELALDSLNIVFWIHLLRHHSTLADNRNIYHRGGMPRSKWNLVNDYIHNNLAHKLRIDQLARVASMSPSHFLRTFRQTTGQTPHQYILNIRLEYASQSIRKGHSFDFVVSQTGFSSQSHLTSAMREKWGITPAKLRSLSKRTATEP